MVRHAVQGSPPCSPCHAPPAPPPVPSCPTAKGNISDSEHERTNSFIGTMEYMAPEVCQCGGV